MKFHSVIIAFDNFFKQLIWGSSKQNGVEDKNILITINLLCHQAATVRMEHQISGDISEECGRDAFSHHWLTLME